MIKTVIKIYVQILLYGAGERQPAIQLSRYGYFRRRQQSWPFIQLSTKMRKMKSFARGARGDRWTEPTLLYIIFTTHRIMVVIVVIVDGVFALFARIHISVYLCCFVPIDFFFQRSRTHRKSGWDGGHSPVLASPTVSHCHNLDLTHSPTRLILCRFIPKPIWFCHAYALSRKVIGKVRYII